MTTVNGLKCFLVEGTVDGGAERGSRTLTKFCEPINLTLFRNRRGFVPYVCIR
jgi:hypothetical protein